MKTINIYKAQPIGDQQIESVNIRIDLVFPNLTRGDPHWADVSMKLFDDEALAIVDALHSLPGGTLDRVLVKLLDEKVSQHIVPWGRRG